MIGPCIVWQCPRVAVANGTYCERHAPDTALVDPGLEYDGADVAYLLAEGMTLAEVAALTT